MTRRRKRRDSRGLSRPALAGISVVVLALLALVGSIAMLAQLGDEEEQQAVVAGQPTASVAGVEVSNPSADLGRVPLDTPVGHSFRVSNRGAATVELGVPAIEVLDGC